MPLQPGEVFSHYRLLRKIGEGGMGVVYEARDQRLLRHVALKFLSSDWIGDPERRRRFLREARLAAAVTHPNIATIFDADEAQAQVFIVMELLAGKTLRALIGEPPMPVTEALTIAQQVARGLACAHQARIVHCDLKPENIMVNADGQVKILDFGLAKPLGELAGAGAPDLGSMTTVTGAGSRALIGTFAYMSPEQACGDRVDIRSDIFSFGIVLFELLTGRLPFSGAGRTGMIGAILRDPPLSAIVLNPSLPPDLAAILDNCLHKSPEERYAGATDLLAALQNVASSTVRIPARPGLASIRDPDPGNAWKFKNPSGARNLLSAATGWIGRLATASEDRQAPVLQEGDAVLVTEFEDRTGEPHLAAAARDVLEYLLGRSTRIEIILGSTTGGLHGGPATATPIPRSVAADVCRREGHAGYVTGDLSRDPAGYRLTVSLLSAKKRRPLLVREFVCRSQDDLLGAVHELVASFRKATGEARAIVNGTPPLTTRSLRAYRALVVALRSDYTERAPLVQRALELDDGFAEAWSFLADAYSGRGRYREARLPAWEALRRAGDQPEPVRLVYEARLHIANYEMDEAIEKLRTATALEPSAADAYRLLSFLHEHVFDDPVSAEAPAWAALRLGRLGVASDLMGILVKQDRASESPSILEAIGHRRSADLHRARVCAHALLATGPAEAFEHEAELLDGHSGVAKCEGESHRLLHHLALGQLAKARRLAASLWRTSTELHDFAYRHFSAMSLAWSNILREESLDLPAEHSQPARDCLIFLPHLAVLCADAGLEAPLAEAVDIHAADLRDSRSRYAIEELGFARGCLDLARGDPGAAIGTLARLARDSPLVRRHRMAGRAFEHLRRWLEAAAEYETAVAQPSMKWSMDNPAVFVFDQYRLARVYERIDNRDRARHWYGRFVADWQDGDHDIPALVAARERLAVLGERPT